MFVKIVIWCTFSAILFSEIRGDGQESITTVSGTHAPRKRICSGDLIFEDNFDTFKLDVWKHEQTLSGMSSNNQFQWYTNNRSNSYVENGKLHIRPTLLADEAGEEFLYKGTIEINGDELTNKCTFSGYNGCMRTGTEEVILNPIKSARINTAESFAFKFGKVEIKAKLPVGDWLWPAIWMKPKWNQYSSWPSSGEIDIVESRGNRQFYRDNVNIGIEQICSTLHWGPNSKYDRYNYTTFDKNNKNGWNKFHKYRLDWYPTSLSFYVDDEHLGTVCPAEEFWKFGKLHLTGLDNPWKSGSRLAPFDDEFYFLINLAVGSTSFFSDYAENKPYEKPWKNNRGRASMTDFWKAKNQWLPTWNVATDDSHLQIDYIKVWAL